MAYNEFLEGRVVSANFTNVPAVAGTTLSSPVYIPTGALVTGVTYYSPASVYTDASNATMSIRAGAVVLCSTQNIAAIPARTIASRPLLVSAGGMYVSTAGNLNVSINGGSVGTGTMSINMYVGYVV